MEKDKQAPSGQASPQAGGAPAVAPPKEEPVNRSQQLAERQAKYWNRVQAARETYFKKSAEAYQTYQDAVVEIYEGGKKQAASKGSEGTLAQGLQAYQAARTDSARSAVALQQQLRAAETKYAQAHGSFWDDIWTEIASAVDEFWNWILGWWEPPVEGGGAPFRTLADWRTALDPGVGPYYAGYNYGASLC